MVDERFALFPGLKCIKTFNIYTTTLNINLKLGELEVPSRKISFKTFEKSESRPTEKISI